MIEKWSSRSVSKTESLHTQQSYNSNSKLLQTLLSKQTKGSVKQANRWPGLQPLSLGKIRSVSQSLKNKNTASRTIQKAQLTNMAKDSQLVTIKEFTKVVMVSEQKNDGNLKTQANFKLLPTNYKQNIIRQHRYPKTARTNDYDTEINSASMGKTASGFATHRIRSEGSTKKILILSSKNYRQDPDAVAAPKQKRLQDIYQQNRRLEDDKKPKKFKIDYETFNYIQKVIDFKDMWRPYVKKG